MTFERLRKSVMLDGLFRKFYGFMIVVSCFHQVPGLDVSNELQVAAHKAVAQGAEKGATETDSVELYAKQIGHSAVQDWRFLF